MTLKFDAIKIGDKLFKTTQDYGSKYYSIITVTNVTKTRFTANNRTYTKDSKEYPRQNGFHRNTVSLEFLDEKKHSILLQEQHLFTALRVFAHEISEMNIVPADNIELSRACLHQLRQYLGLDKA